MGENSMLGIDAEARIPILVGITGHRRLDPAWAGGPGTGLYGAVRAKLTAMRQHPPKDATVNEKAQSYPHSPLMLISCLAEGADQLALAAALGLAWSGVRWVERDPALVDGFIAVLPLPVALLETDFDPDYGVAFHADSLARFRGLLERATSVIPMHEFEDLSPRNQPWSGNPPSDNAPSDNRPFGRADVGAPDHDPEIRRAYYGLAGEYLARRCHVLLALWDGVEPEAQSQSPSNGSAPIRGESTLAAMRIKAGGRPLGPALGLGLRPQSTWPYLPDVHTIHPPESGLVWQVIAPRPGQQDPPATASFVPYLWTHPLDKTDHTGAQGSQDPAHTHTHTEAHPGSKAPEHDSQVQAIIREIDEHNRRLTKYAPHTAKDPESYPLGPLDQPEVAPLRVQYHNADSLALLYQSRARSGVWILFWLGVLAAVAFVCYAKLFLEPHKYLALGAYLGAFAYGGWRIRQLRWQEARRLHEACRSFAEALRVQLAWRLARIDDMVADHYLQRYRGDVLWVRRAIEGMLLLHPPTPSDFDHSGAQRVYEGWVLDQKKFMAGKVVVNEKNLRNPRHMKGFGLLLHTRVVGLLSCSVVVAVALALWKGSTAIGKILAGGEANSSSHYLATATAEAPHFLSLFEGGLLLATALWAAVVMVQLAQAKWYELRQEAKHDRAVADLEFRTLLRIALMAFGFTALAVFVAGHLAGVPGINQVFVHDENAPYVFWGACIGMLISLAGLFDFLSDKMAYKEHAANYAEAKALFQRVESETKRNLYTAPWTNAQAHEFQEIARRLGHEALDGNTLWMMFQRSKPLDLPHVH